MSIFVCKFCGDNARHEYLTQETFNKMKNSLKHHLIRHHSDVFGLNNLDDEVLDYFVEKEGGETKE